MFRIMWDLWGPSWLCNALGSCIWPSPRPGPYNPLYCPINREIHVTGFLLLQNFIISKTSHSQLPTFSNSQYIYAPVRSSTCPPPDMVWVQPVRSSNNPPLPGMIWVELLNTHFQVFYGQSCCNGKRRSGSMSKFNQEKQLSKSYSWWVFERPAFNWLPNDLWRDLKMPLNAFERPFVGL